MYRTKSDLTYRFRAPSTNKEMGNLVNILLSEGLFNFNIKDNQGQSSKINRISNDASYNYTGLITSSTEPIVGFKEMTGWLYTDGLHQTNFNFQRYIHGGSIAIPHLFKDKLVKKDDISVCYIIGVKISIPKEDISKYSKFIIERKSTTI